MSENKSSETVVKAIIKTLDFSELIRSKRRNLFLKGDKKFLKCFDSGRVSAQSFKNSLKAHVLQMALNNLDA
jgi:hypothetical protein